MQGAKSHVLPSHLLTHKAIRSHASGQRAQIEHVEIGMAATQTGHLIPGHEAGRPYPLSSLHSFLIFLL